MQNLKSQRGNLNTTTLPEKKQDRTNVNDMNDFLFVCVATFSTPYIPLCNLVLLKLEHTLSQPCG